MLTYAGKSAQSSTLGKRINNTSGPESAGNLHLKDNEHSFDNVDVHILDKIDKWFKRGVREAIHVQTENPSFNTGEVSETICLLFTKLPFKHY